MNAELFAIKKELTIRNARKSMLDFTLYTNPTYETGWFNELLCMELDKFFYDVEAGKVPRLMVFAPPRSGKSELCSRRFPAYALGRNPKSNIISCSYASELAERMSRDVKRIIESPQYKDVFPTVHLPQGRGALSGVNKSDLWEPVDANGGVFGGSYRAAGVNGGITGQGMHIGIIDDPAKDYAMASSKTYQEGVIDWYDTTFFTRRDPKINGILIILTRWHPNDLAGQLLDRAKQGGEEWRVVSFPMEAEETEYHEINGVTYKLREPGDLLFPERMPREFVEAAKKSGSLTWNALYQQRPTAKGGGLIKTDWFGYYQELPPLQWRAIYADTALKVKEHNDFSVFQHWGMGKDGYMYLIDQMRGKWEAEELQTRAIGFWNKCNSLNNGRLRHMAVEDKASGTGLIQSIRRSAHCPIKAIQRNKDKYTRLMDSQGHIESGYIKLPKDAPWLIDFLSEMEGIDANFKTHDDQLDPMMDAINEMRNKPPMQINPAILNFV